MMKQNELVELLLSIQDEADKKNLSVDVFKMYSAFYEQYQLMYKQKPDYLKIMNNVNNWVLAQINEAIACKEAYHKQIHT